jgi:hypothetical protein
MVYAEQNAITGQTVVCDVVINKKIENNEEIYQANNEIVGNRE